MNDLIERFIAIRMEQLGWPTFTYEDMEVSVSKKRACSFVVSLHLDIQEVFELRKAYYLRRWADKPVKLIQMRRLLAEDRKLYQWVFDTGTGRVHRSPGDDRSVFAVGFEPHALLDVPLSEVPEPIRKNVEGFVSSSDWDDWFGELVEFVGFRWEQDAKKVSEEATALLHSMQQHLDGPTEQVWRFETAHYRTTLLKSPGLLLARHLPDENDDDRFMDVMNALSSTDKRYYKIEVHIEKLSDSLLPEQLMMLRRCALIDQKNDNAWMGGYRNLLTREAIQTLRSV